MVRIFGKNFLQDILFVIFICFISFNFFINNLIAKNEEETFLMANDLYVNKKYKEALDLYLSIDKKGPIIFYNIGNCEFRLNNNINALIYWNKAKENSNFGLLSSINNNIDIVNEKLGIGKEALKDRIVDFVNIFSLFSLQIYFIIFWLLLFAMFVFLKKFRLFFLTLNITIVFVFGTLVFIKYGCKLYPKVIAKSKVEIFSGENENYHKLLEVQAGNKLLLKKIKDNWYKVKYKGVTGWANNNIAKTGTKAAMEII